MFSALSEACKERNTAEVKRLLATATIDDMSHLDEVFCFILVHYLKFDGIVLC